MARKAFSAPTLSPVTARTALVSFGFVCLVRNVHTRGRLFRPTVVLQLHGLHVRVAEVSLGELHVDAAEGVVGRDRGTG